MQYNLFISHSWTYSDQYQRLINLLDSKYGLTIGIIRFPKTILFTMREAITSFAKPLSVR